MTSLVLDTGLSAIIRSSSHSILNLPYLHTLRTSSWQMFDLVTHPRLLHVLRITLTLVLVRSCVRWVLNVKVRGRVSILFHTFDWVIFKVLSEQRSTRRPSAFERGCLRASSRFESLSISNIFLIFSLIHSIKLFAKLCHDLNRG